MSTADPPPIPESVLAEHAEFVRRVARGIVGDDALAEDIAQETLLRAHQRPPRAPGALRSWLARVARNLALTTRGRNAAVERWERQAARPESTPESAAAGGAVEREALLRSVVDAVLGLDDPYRTTVLLRYFDGLSAVQIGARMGVPASTVRTRLKRALAQLRDGLDDEHDGSRAAWFPVLAATFARPPGAAPATPLGTGAHPAPTAHPAPAAPPPAIPPCAGRLLMTAGTKKLGLVLGALGVAAIALVAALQAWDAPGGTRRSTDAADVSPDTGDGRTVRTRTGGADRAASGGPDAAPGGDAAATLGGAWISGEVRRLSDDAPAEGVEVRLTAADVGGRSAEARIAVTGAGGVFRFAGLDHADGPFTLVAANPGGPDPRVEEIHLVPEQRLHAGTLWLSGPLGVVVEVVDEAGRPVSGAHVAAHAERSVADARDYRGTPVQPVLEADTDATGRAALEELTAGRWAFRVTHAAHAPGGVAGIDVRREREEHVVRVVLERGSPLTGRVTDTDGEPLAGVRVVALPPRDGTVVFEPPVREVLRAEAVSDAEGDYRFPALARGPHSIGVAFEGGSVARLWVVEIPMVSRYDIRLANSGVRGVVREEASGSGIEGAGIEGAGIEGAGIEGAGIEGAIVRFGAWRAHHPTYYTGITDAEGRYEIRVPVACYIHGAPRGEGGGRVRGIDFAVERPGYVVVPGGVESDSRGNWVGGPAGEEFAEWNVTMRRGARLEGVVRGPDGPVPSARVTAEVWHAFLGSVRSTTVTDAEGRYAFDTLLDGRAKVTVEKRGLFQSPASAGDWLAETDPPVELVVEVPAQGGAELDLAMIRAATAGGTVTTAGGTPIEGAEVVVAGSAAPPVLTAANGSFEVAGLPLGEPVEVRASREGYGEATAAVTVSGEDPPEPLALVLPEAAAVTGSVAAESGAPVPGAYVQFAPAETLEKGSYLLVSIWERAPKHPVAPDGTFEVPVPAGTAVRVRAAAPGFAPTLSGRLIAEGGEAAGPADLRLGRGSVLTGRVTAADGSGGVAGVTIEFVNAKMPLELSQTRADTFNAGGRPFEIVAVTGPDGTFEVQGLLEWNYQVRALADGWLPGHATAKVPGDDALEIELRRGLEITGTVVYEDEQPAAGARVVAVRPGGGPVGASTAAADGAFRLAGLPVGSYRLRVEPAPFGTADVLPTDAGEARAGDVDVRLVAERGAGAIAGVCVAPDGAPLPGVYVSAKPMEAGQAGVTLLRARSEQDGSFRLTGLDDCAYTLIAQAPRGMGGPEEYGRRRSVEVLDVAPGTEGLRLELTDTIAWTGRVVRADGEPLPHGTRIHLRTGERSPWTLIRRLGPDGAFSFPTVRPLPHLVSIVDPATGTPLPLVGGGSVTPGEEPARLVVSSTAAIAGVAVGTDGRPLAGVGVVALADAEGGETVAHARTDVAGNFQLAGLEDGVSYRIIAAHDRHGRAEASAARMGDQGLRLRLAPEPEFAVCLVDAAGQPVRGALLRITDADGRARGSLRTDADGKAATRALPAGDYRVELLDPDGGEPALLGTASPGAGEVRLRRN